MSSKRSLAHDVHPSIEEQGHGSPCFVCYDGQVYIGHHELTEEGEEIEVVEAVPCKRCKQA